MSGTDVKSPMDDERARLRKEAQMMEQASTPPTAEQGSVSLT